MVDCIQSDLSEHATIHAIEASLFGLIKLRSLLSHAEVEDTPEMLSCCKDVPYPHFNVILRTKLSQPRMDSAIQSADERCKNRKVPMGWIISPSTTPAQFAEELHKHGYTHVANNSGMAIDLNKIDKLAPPPAAVNIQRPQWRKE
jgi:hypothetical protein